MTIKYIGMIFIFVCTTLIGNGLAVSEKRKIERGEALRGLIAKISREIECFKAPLDTIYNSYSSTLLDKLGFLEVVRKKSLRDALAESGNIFCYKEDTYNALVGFADFLGKSECSDQLSRCKYILSLIDEDLKKSREAYPKNRKMYSSLGVLAGVMIIILLL